MILITGAPGKTGRAVIRALAKRRARVRAFARRSDQVAGLRALGAEDVPVGDLRDGASVARALRGVRAIYHMAPNVSPDELTMARVVIAAAREADVEHLVFHSVLHPQIEAMAHHWQKMRVEELLLQSGLHYTVLQPTIYMQNILASWDAISQNGVYPVPYAANTRLSLVDLEDVAEAAATILTQPGYLGATIELVGAADISPSGIAEVLQHQLNRPVAPEVVPLEVWERGVRASGLGDYQVSTLIKMFRYYESHGFVGNTGALSSLLRRQPTSLDAFVARTVSADHDGLPVH